MPIKIFISWSGERSRLAAQALANWLPRVIQSVKPWMSDVSIVKGERWSREISEALADQDIGIFCITPENYSAPWLVFEAGALSTTATQIRVCPLLFGMMADDLEGPLTQFQATIFDRNDFFKLLQAINELSQDDKLGEAVLRDIFDKFWPTLEEAIQKILAIGLEGRQTEIRQIIKVFSKYGFSEPVLGNYASFGSGYESHQLYSTVGSIAVRRLYIYGRKNRKLFDKEHFDLLKSLAEKIKAGFDLKLLFLDPSAPAEVTHKAHRDADINTQVGNSISNAIKVLRSFGIDPALVCRKYSTVRPNGLIIVDDAVLHSPFEYDENGVVKPTTKSAFSVLSSQSSFGEELVSNFLDTWRRSKELES
jgi:hypothetical protein